MGLGRLLRVPLGKRRAGLKATSGSNTILP